MTERSDGMGDEVYQPGDPDAHEDEGILDVEDTLNDRGVDPYDEGWSPPERPLGVEHTGVTAAERLHGESLDERLAEERPDPVIDAYEALESGDDDADGIGDLRGGEGEPVDLEVGGRRAGRLVAPDEGAHEDAEKDMLAADVGFGGGAASAEEAAVHLVDEDDVYEDDAYEVDAYDKDA
ncbi:DUF5709 domain-containing protein [Streptomyces sp. VRA16 Mangrove soil]|uniref:DUF5709 domain-containing protein n=1 Tax=Streptomyces sp. VRA16 Mangrove soil TaxID=2817434 RepID=UPI001A9E3476|nr:DUF5709 domain-containing protein [Streptomyces sp. VRA16 Mangrove soil]MBO1332859.1 hypothetical protein [Streptomyces sp. VRA16 Mangrove soil]